MQRYRFDLKLKRKWQGILEIPAKLNMVATNVTLSDTHAGLNDVHDIVAQFLTLVDEIHVDGTYGVGIFMVVHISDVLRLQLVAVVVDLMLNIE